MRLYVTVNNWALSGEKNSFGEKERDWDRGRHQFPARPHLTSLLLQKIFHMKLFALNIEQVLNIYELSPLEEDFVLGERGDRVGKVPRWSSSSSSLSLSLLGHGRPTAGMA